MDLRQTLLGLQLDTLHLAIGPDTSMHRMVAALPEASLTTTC